VSSSPQSARPKKKRTRLYAAVLVVLVVIIIIIAAASYVSSTQTAKITYSTQAASSIGVSTPTQGNEYVILTMNIHDNGCSDFIVSPFNFQMTAGGLTYSTDSATFALSNTLQVVTLQAGGAASGAVAFQVPSGSSGYAFSYTAGGSCTINWVNS
jgi:hypothetical protein